MLQSKFWSWWEQYSGYVLGPSLVVVAVILGYFVVPRHPSRFVDELAIALMIAGILTATVDPFMKRQARREATRDIFHHMLGFSLPEVIRERLQNSVEQTKLYREGMAQRIVMSEDGDSVVFDVEMEFAVVNPTPHPLPFPPLLQFEKGERAVLKSVVCFDDLDCGKNAQLSPREGGLGALEYRGKEVKIPSGGRCKFKYEYLVKLPTSLGYWYPNFGSPTIGLSLTIKFPEHFSVVATKADSKAPGEWRYPNKLFMPGEHLEIAWDKLN